ncbi:reverse transcriptase domain-containing protein [Tanacetum coccineum]
MLLGRTAMPSMGIVFSTIQGAIKFHTKKGIGTVFSTAEADKGTKRARRIPATNEEMILSCVNAEEKSSVMEDGECVDFTDINKACPKDCYPLPEIDWKIESLLGFCLKYFLDTYKGYHQIQMVEKDEDKTAFYAGEGVFCYKKMSFGLKNARASYQRLVDKVFSHQIGRNLEAYVDDMVIKSTSKEEMLKDIYETFKRFRSINMKLNPNKCSFGVEEGPFLGHLITKHGIKANPSEVKAVTDLDQPRTLNDIQSLNGKLTALSQFLSKGAKQSLAFFKVLKGVLQGAELNYPALEKLILTLVHAARRLRRYFQADTITVLTNTPIKQILIGPEKTRRVAKWAIKLGKHDIVLVRREEKEMSSDFLVEILSEDNEKKEKPKEVPDSSSKWRLYTDGASNLDGSGAGLMLIDPEGKEYTYALCFEFKATNNEAEYEALLAGLRIAQEMEITKVAIFMHFQLLVNQIKGTFAAKQASIKEYLQKVKTTLKGFEDYTVEHMRRNHNKKADALSKLASMTFEHLIKKVLVEVLTKRLIEEKEVLKVDIQERKSWMDPIHEYLLSGLLPEDTRESRKIIIQAPQYKLIRGNLYKRSFFKPWLCCVAPPQTDKIIKEIHEGSCGFNAEPSSLVVRITKQVFYWPSTHREVAKSIQDCEKCKEQSAIRKAGTSRAIVVGST